MIPSDGQMDWKGRETPCGRTESVGSSTLDLRRGLLPDRASGSNDLKHDQYGQMVAHIQKDFRHAKMKLFRW